MNKHLQQRYDTEVKRHRAIIEQIANERLTDMLREWTRTYPKRNLKLAFGMGTEFIKVDDKAVETWDFPIIEAALKDVWNITDSYRIGCPRDMSVTQK